MASNITEVEGVLAEIDAADVPVIKVYNKIDLQDGAVPGSERDSDGSVEAVWLSAQSGAGLNSLLQAIQERLINDVIEITCRLSPRRGRLRAKLYEAGVVIAEHNRSDGDTMLDVRIASASWQRLLRLEGLTADQVVIASATDWENQKTEGEKLALAT
jgi:GTPase